MFDHPHSFDPTYGYDLPSLLDVRAPATVEGFEAFWRETYARTLNVATKATLTPSSLKQRGRLVFDIEYDGFDGFRVGGWLTLPESGAVTCGFVYGHGYGGRGAPEEFVPIDQAAAIFPCARGFDRSARPDLPTRGATHVVHGIESVDTYMHRFCVMDLWSATSALIELLPQTSESIFYSGTSFGGGLGALALPWEPRWRAGFLDVPSFGNHALRVKLECAGSGDAVRQRHQAQPEVMNVLRFYDAAVASRFTRIPTYVAAARFDPVVPPPGQFSVFNEMTCEKKLFVREAAHFSWPGQVAEERRLRRELQTWFAEHRSES